MIYFQAMEKYELTIVLDPKVTTAKKKKVIETVEKVAGIVKGNLGKMEDWGLVGTGLYLHFPLELETSSVKTVSTKINQESEILKYLLIRKGK